MLSVTGDEKARWRRVLERDGRNILVVGAGLAGAVYARVLADEDYRVTVVESRAHIAGNCYDEVDQNGVRVHKYGPHLFHTSNEKVVSWLSRFTEWTPYEHRVVARLPDGRLAPLPVNMNTVNLVFDRSFTSPAETKAFLALVAEKPDTIETAEDHLFSIIGRKLSELFFRPYTQKMWAMDLSEMPPSVVRRLKVRMDTDPRYFLDDTFQAMPANGYTAMFEKMFDHENITIHLGRSFEKTDEAQFVHVFNSMPIDAYFDFRFGELPYRSIRFHTSSVAANDAASQVVINYTDSGPFTRETWWHNIPGHLVTESSHVTRTIEEPCDYRDNEMERYYPAKTKDGRFDALYQRYKTLASERNNMTFIGRCGTYQYLDMHQVVNQSL
ncbi:MAG: UDP-galactopyranose mutase, partial [bacterium]|nr:UDP-galactopyranose mutase [bacterium]